MAAVAALVAVLVVWPGAAGAQSEPENALVQSAAYLPGASGTAHPASGSADPAGGGSADPPPASSGADSASGSADSASGSADSAGAARVACSAADDAFKLLCEAHRLILNTYVDPDVNADPVDSASLAAAAAAGVRYARLGAITGAPPACALPTPDFEEFCKETDKVSDTDAAVWAATDAMIRSLGDMHSYLRTPASYARYLTGLRDNSNRFRSGVGMGLMDGDDYCAVVSASCRPVIFEVYPGSAAEAAGLRVGDVVEKWNGSLAGLTCANVDGLDIYGSGEAVEVEVRRGVDTVTATLKPTRLAVPVARGRVVDGDVGYLRIDVFSDHAGSGLKTVLNELISSGISGLVLDLRNNRGGWVSTSREVAGLFLPAGSLVSNFEGKKKSNFEGKKNRKILASGSPLAADPAVLPMVIAVNARSASGSEFVTGALVDHGRAKVVGAATYGKYTGQMATEVKHSDGSLIGAVRLTYFRFYSPLMRSSKGGYEPDVAMDLPMCLHPVETTRRAVAALRPAITQLAITSSPASGKAYTPGETVTATVTFDQQVTVDSTAGAPALALKVGDQQRQAVHKPDRAKRAAANPAATELHFEYVVVSGDSDTDGIEIEADSLNLNGAKIEHPAGLDAVVTHNALAADPSALVNRVTCTDADDAFKLLCEAHRLILNTYVDPDVNADPVDSASLAAAAAAGVRNARLGAITGAPPACALPTPDFEEFCKETDKVSDTEAAVWAATDAMIDSLGDRHSYLMTPASYARYLAGFGDLTGLGDNSNRFRSGVGMGLMDGDDYCAVVSASCRPVIFEVYPGSAAEVAGLRVGDVVEKWNGSLAGLTCANVDGLDIYGSGEAVEVEVRRGADTVTATLKPTRLAVPVARGRVVDGDVGYLRLDIFSDHAGSGLKTVLNELISSGISGLVLDLRNNRGGWVKPSREVAGLFLPAGSLVANFEGKKNRKILASGSPLAADPAVLPMVIAVNARSASGSEFVTGALVDHGRAKVVGAATYGKYTGQITTEVKHSDGSLIGAVRLTDIRFYSPLMRSSKGGYEPDVAMDLPMCLHPVETTRRAVAALRPAITQLAITSSPASGKAYTPGETVTATVTFDQQVTVDSTAGAPALALKVGDQQRQAVHKPDRAKRAAANPAATELHFEYVVVSGDSDTDGIEIEADSLNLNGAKIEHPAGLDAVVTHNALAADPSALILILNRAPVFAGSTVALSLREGATAAGAVAAVDPDAGDTLTYTLTGSDAAAFTITSSGALTLKAAADYETKKSYRVTVTATDSGGLTDTVTVTVTITNLNEAPAFAAATMSLEVREGATTAGTVTAVDPDTDDTLTYTLTGSDAAAFTITSSGALTLKAAPDYETKNSYRVTVTATDSGGLTDTVTVTVTITNLNEAPAFASSTVAVSLREGATAAGAVAAVDPDAGDTLTYTLTGSDAAAFTITSSGALTLKAAPDYETKKSYRVTVTATDSGGLTDTVTVTVTITNLNEAPGAPEALEVTAAVKGLRLSWSAPATAAGTPAVSGYEIQYRLRTAAGPPAAWGLWRSHPHSAAAQSAQIAGLDAGATYQVRVSASNADGHSDWTTPASGVPLAPPPTNEAPAFAAATMSLEVREGATTAGTVTAVDPDPDDTLTYTLGGSDAAAFTITSGGALTLKTAPDYETKSAYRVTVTATDSGGLSDTIAVTVTITNVNEAPAFAASTVALSVREGATAAGTVAAVDPDAGDTLTYTLTGSDAAAFTITSSGALTLKTAPDYETKKSYRVTVTATDSGGLSDTIAVTVTITNVNEVPGAPEALAVTAAVKGLRLSWSAPATAAGTPAVSGYEIQYRPRTAAGPPVAWGAWRSHPHSAAAQSAQIAGLDAGAPYQVRVSASNADGHSDWTTPASGVPLAPPPTNEAPAFAAATMSLEVREGATTAGTVTAVDPDPDDTLTYTLGGSDAAAFTITSGGALTLKTAPDYETKSAYRVTVTATDSGGLSDTIAVTVTITNVNEAPAFAASTVALSVREGATAAGTVAAVDPDAGDTLTYTLGGSDAAAFTIAGSGALTLKTAPDYETKNSYRVTVTATDSGGLTDTIAVAITITDVNEGRVTPQAASTPPEPPSSSGASSEPPSSMPASSPAASSGPASSEPSAGTGAGSAGKATEFTDVKDFPHRSNIRRIAEAGVTKGCNPPANDRFCPNRAVTRAQMASFLARALRLPAPSRDYFTDDDGTTHEDNVNRLAEAGVTKGCNPPANDRFCPNRVVTRAQMASFLARALRLPAPSRDYFTDDDGTTHEDNVNRLAEAGVTKGCNPPANDRFCPDRVVTRAQMASFLARALARESAQQPPRGSGS